MIFDEKDQKFKRLRENFLSLKKNLQIFSL